MSTEHQQYSPENQLEVVRQYAGAHNMEIVQDYSDHGRSGLNIAGRDGLNQLMADVEAKRTNFTSLLVYDVSRWGRFQDVDESAYYEYVLKKEPESGSITAPNSSRTTGESGRIQRSANSNRAPLNQRMGLPDSRWELPDSRWEARCPDGWSTYSLAPPPTLTCTL
jgi:DNA invertase Pin-like site-specific DNA recombinase